VFTITVLEEPEDPANRSFFSEIISSISDVQFSHNGRYLLTRDYLSLKIWDLNMDTKPVETYPVHEHLRSKLCALYENDCIFDKFECAWSGNDRYAMTHHASRKTIPSRSYFPQSLYAGLQWTFFMLNRMIIVAPIALTCSTLIFIKYHPKMT